MGTTTRDTPPRTSKSQPACSRRGVLLPVQGTRLDLTVFINLHKYFWAFHISLQWLRQRAMIESLLLRGSAITYIWLKINSWAAEKFLRFAKLLSSLILRGIASTSREINNSDLYSQLIFLKVQSSGIFRSLFSFCECVCNVAMNNSRSQSAIIYTHAQRALNLNALINDGWSYLICLVESRS